MGATLEDSLAIRLERIRARMAAACVRSGRATDSVRLLPVSKTHPPETVAEGVRAGLDVFGESRVQEARQKIPLCPGGAHWHFIGHLQTNKVREAVGLFEMIHAVDSLRLLETLDRACAEAGRPMPVCLEVNVAGERSKFGLKPDELGGVFERAAGLFKVQIVGLMTIPPVAEDVETARPFFRQLRELQATWRARTGLPLPELSMGMSHDFEIAIEEGATWVRVGTLLFGQRPRVEAHEADIP
jgi:pyridoxal phosphate enzyme (YggS family)